MRESKKAVRGAGRVAFLASLAGIKKMVDEGHPLLSIYKEYEKSMSISYSQFVRYVGRYIKGDVRTEPKPDPEPASKPKKTESGLPKFEKKERNRDDLV